MDASHREWEWLETDGLGGFASGTALGLRTRRYHALLLNALTPPTGRMALVKGIDAWVETGNDFNFLNPQTYFPNVQVPEKTDALVSFESESLAPLGLPAYQRSFIGIRTFSFRTAIP